MNLSRKLLEHREQVWTSNFLNLIGNKISQPHNRVIAERSNFSFVTNWPLSGRSEFESRGGHKLRVRTKHNLYGMAKNTHGTCLHHGVLLQTNLHTHSCYPIKCKHAKRVIKILGPATYQSPPKSYIAGPRQVLEATPPLSWSNHREKSRKAEEKKSQPH